MQSPEDSFACPVFAHLDLDQFFVAVERILDPRLRGIPLCVGGEDPKARGAVACASYEARAYGIHAGMALRRARALCPQARFVSGHFDEYLRASRRVLALLEGRLPRVVPRSIDEFSLDLTGCERLLGDPSRLVEGLRVTLRLETGLDSTVGLAGTPLTAKVASSQAKPNGFLCIVPGSEADFLAPLPLRSLPGVGPKTELRLRELGLRRIGDLAQLDPRVLRAALGAAGESLGVRARGGLARLDERAPAMPFVGKDDGAKEVLRDGLFGRSPEGERVARSLSRERTFLEDQDDQGVLDAALVRLVEQAVGSLRVQGLRARSLAVHVRYADLKTISKHLRLPPEAEEDQVLQLGRRLLGALLERRLRIRRLGVALLNLYPAAEQLTLFEGPGARSRRALGHTLDRVRTRFGWESMRLGAGLVDSPAKEGS